MVNMFSQAPSKLIYMLDMSMPEEVVLRVLTLLANLASVTKRLDIDPLDLPAENKAAAPDTMSANLFLFNFKKFYIYLYFLGMQLSLAYQW